ncbi:MAG: hypothetical protein Q9217_004116 [Psora testacea]
MPYHDPHNPRRRSYSPSALDCQRISKRSRSPISHHNYSHRSSRRPKLSRPVVPVLLPFNASFISKYDFKEYKPMLGLYLDIQKHRILEDLPEEEARGRWKSFVGKWNRGELAEGWYDPATLQKAKATAASSGDDTEPQEGRRPPPIYNGRIENEGSSDEEELGPALPRDHIKTYTGDQKSGPAMPHTQDLEMQSELERENAEAEREALRFGRRQERKAQKERLEELVPRAEAGSKDRLLEKRREKADACRVFAFAKTEAGGVEEVPESDLLGEEDGGLAGFKKRKMETERKKNERELRKEAILRERAEEREERVRAYREKEARTMSGLVALAKARFG